jgi:hypothetical protein
MNAIELNMRLLKGAILMREDERRWHKQCFSHLGVDFPVHNFDGCEKAVAYWVKFKLLPAKEEVCLDLPIIGKRRRHKRVKFPF